MKLDEAQTRAKVIELLDGMNQARMDLWLSSGIAAGVLNGVLVDRILRQELHERSPEVIAYWDGPCNCGGHLN